MAKQIHTCKRCFLQFVPKRVENKTYCSRKCCFQHRKETALTEQQIVAKRRAKLAPLKKVFKPILCDVCSMPFTPRASNNKLCCVACRKADARKKALAHYQLNSGVDKSERSCKECGTQFKPVFGSKRRTYCSTDCCHKSGKRIGRLKRKAKLRSVQVEPVNPYRVFDRDGWRCQLCGIRTPRRLRGTLHDNAPELDHIMPLAKGGAHSYVNTQCACRSCNAIKKDTPKGQLLLIG